MCVWGLESFRGSPVSYLTSDDPWVFDTVTRGWLSCLTIVALCCTQHAKKKDFDAELLNSLNMRPSRLNKAL